jgi:hypothetical protein
MPEERDEALDRMAEDQRILAEGLEAETREDQEQVKAAGPPKRPWWKVWART